MNQTIVKSAICTSVLSLLFGTPLHAAGLSLSQIGTAESVATAGVAGITNNEDSSAVISNPAGLAGIEQSSMVVGAQLLDIKSEFNRAASGEQNTNQSESSGRQIIPHLSYAKRLSEDWVVGGAIHSPGGLGVAYDNGVAAGPLGIVDTNKITMLNFTASAAYRLSDRLSVGGSVIAQYAGVEVAALSDSNNPVSIEGDNVSTTFALAANYQLFDSTELGFKYQHGSEHDIEFEEPAILPGSMPLNWPASIELGIKHQITDRVSLMANTNWQSWSDYDDKYSDTFSTGIAIEYQMDKWAFQMGASIDSSPLDAADRDVILPLDKQWRVGIGAERSFSDGSALSLAYQYQNLGEGIISAPGYSPIQPTGFYEENRIHFLTLSYRF